MANLFDTVKGGLGMMGGYGQARRADEELKSLDTYRKGSLETQKSIAQSQNELAKYLQGQKIVSDEKMQALEHINRKDLLDLNISYKKWETAYNNLNETERLQLKLDMEDRWKKIEADLQRQGIEVKWAEVNKIMPYQMAYILKAFEIVHKSFTGVEGLATLYSGQVEGGSQELINRMMESLGVITSMGGIDPKLLPKVTHVGGAKANQKASVTTPDKAETPQFSGPTLGSVAPPAPSSTFPPTTVPKIEVPPGYNAPQFDTSPPWLPDNTFKSSSPLDTNAPAYNQRQSLGLDPGDEHSLNMLAAKIKSTKEPTVALAEYMSIINDPNSPVFGTKNMNPADQTKYRALLNDRLRNLVNPYLVGK